MRYILFTLIACEFHVIIGVDNYKETTLKKKNFLLYRICVTEKITGKSKKTRGRNKKKKTDRICILKPSTLI